MTLNITLITKQSIYLSADHRITNADTKALITDTSTKLIVLQYGEWDGLVSYTGIGMWNYRDTSDYVVDWLTGIDKVGPEQIAHKICEEGTNWLQNIEKKWCRKKHTFVFAAFQENTPAVYIISNFENHMGRNDKFPASTLAISSWRFKGKNHLIVTGQKSAIDRSSKKKIFRIANVPRVSSARIRNLLSEVNNKAAQSPNSQGTISQSCSSVSFRVDGQGAADSSGPVFIRTISFGRPSPSIDEQRKRLGFNPGQGKIVAMAFASSKKLLSPEKCSPEIVIPAGGEAYGIIDITPPKLKSANATRVNNAGEILGCGDSMLWTFPPDAPVRILEISANPGGINEHGCVVGQATMEDGSHHAIKWDKELLIDLGTSCKFDSEATCINKNGAIGGWIGVDSKDHGHFSQRPALWIENNSYVLNNFGCDWGRVIDVREDNVALVLGYKGIHEVYSLWWQIPEKIEVVGGATGVYPLLVSSNGIVLGICGRKPYIAGPGQGWQRIDIPPDFSARGMNGSGDIVGIVFRNGVGMPWLRKSTGEIIFLPYYNYHTCLPNAINDSGIVVGSASADGCVHAILWHTRQSP